MRWYCNQESQLYIPIVIVYLNLPQQFFKGLGKV